MCNNSFFFVIEGIDGSGKSTISKNICYILQETVGKNVKLTFEPHDPSCSGLFIRQILMKKLKNVPNETLAFAFAVNRLDHCDREIVPFLDGKNRVVVCDRYVLSSLVYQSDEKLSLEKVYNLNSFSRRPDLTIFLNANDRTCYKRLRHRNEDKELFEKHLSQVRTKYFEAIEFLKEKGETVEIVSAEGTQNEVLTRVLNVFANHAPNWLPIQYSIPIKEDESFVTFTDITFQKITDSFTYLWDQNPIIGKENLVNVLNIIKDSIEEKLASLSINDISTLFFEYLEVNRYEQTGKIEWTDLDVYGLKYTLPLRINQRGMALIFGKNQRYDSVFNKVLSKPESMSDFMFILDTNPIHLINDYYEREIIPNGKSKLSPTLKIITIRELCSFTLHTVIDHFKEYNIQSYRSLSFFEKTIAEFLCNNT